jgi:rhodanese-related sulfurtransferase
VAAEPIDVKTALEMTRVGDTVIDVREPAEYEDAHIDGAINIPIGALPGAELPAGPLITTCATGRRAERAAGMLDDLGRTAFWIDGGTEAWQVKALPVISGPDPTTPRLRDRLGPVSTVADAVAAKAETVTDKLVENVSAAAGTVAAKAETMTEKVVDKLKPHH